MKFWWMKYVDTDDDDNNLEAVHQTKESAERQACYFFIEKCLSQRDPDNDDRDHAQRVRRFFQEVSLGGYARALATAQEIIEVQEWSERLEVLEAEFMAEADSPLLEALDAERRRWDGVEEEMDSSEETEASAG